VFILTNEFSNKQNVRRAQNRQVSLLFLAFSFASFLGLGFERLAHFVSPKERLHNDGGLKSTLMEFSCRKE